MFEGSPRSNTNIASRRSTFISEADGQPNDQLITGPWFQRSDPAPHLSRRTKRGAKAPRFASRHWNGNQPHFNSASAALNVPLGRIALLTSAMSGW